MLLTIPDVLNAAQVKRSLEILNAAEWVEDCWNPTYRGAPNDGSAWTNGDCSLRVLRGGSFTDKAIAVRSSARFRYDEDVRYYANGFRVARDLD